MQSVALEQQQWIAVINMLAEQPFKLSAPIILAIQQQLSVPPQPPQHAPVNGEAAIQ